jgi:hypothetical protein
MQKSVIALALLCDNDLFTTMDNQGELLGPEWGGLENFTNNCILMVKGCPTRSMLFICTITEEQGTLCRGRFHPSRSLSRSGFKAGVRDNA